MGEGEMILHRVGMHRDCCCRRLLLLLLLLVMARGDGALREEEGVGEAHRLLTSGWGQCR